MNAYELNAYDHGATCVVGCDEAGRGPLAGPVVVACCVLPKDFYDERINDSKKLSEKKRESLFEYIKEVALDYAIVVYDAKKVDELNVYQASRLGMIEAVQSLKKVKPDYILTDAMPLGIDITTEAIIKGDAKSQSIAAASILAKVTRDHLMMDYDQQYPMYNFKKHKGYPTKEHLALLKAYGPCPIHRRSFGPVKAFFEEQMTLF